MNRTVGDSFLMALLWILIAGHQLDWLDAGPDWMGIGSLILAASNIILGTIKWTKS